MGDLYTEKIYKYPDPDETYSTIHLKYKAKNREGEIGENKEVILFQRKIDDKNITNEDFGICINSREVKIDLPLRYCLPSSINSKVIGNMSTEYAIDVLRDWKEIRNSLIEKKVSQDLIK